MACEVTRCHQYSSCSGGFGITHKLPISNFLATNLVITRADLHVNCSQEWLHGPKYGTVQLSTTHKVRSLTDPTEGVANSYSRLNQPIMYVPITVLKAL